MSFERSIAQNLAQLCARVDQAKLRRGPGPQVTLIGVSKFQPASAIESAIIAGLADIGENYAQELMAKQRELSHLRGIHWHFIGALQSNKLKHLVGRVALIHTVERAEHLAKMDRLAAERGVVQDVLVEINLASEPQKSGCLPERASSLLEQMIKLSHVRCRGFMAIPPSGDSPEHSRPWFRKLRELRDSLWREFPELDLAVLSMGMSEDFEIAIEEGATHVRVGTALFGPRPPRTAEIS